MHLAAILLLVYCIVLHWLSREFKLIFSKVPLEKNVEREWKCWILAWPILTIALILILLVASSRALWDFSRGKI